MRSVNNHSEVLRNLSTRISTTSKGHLFQASEAELTALDPVTKVSVHAVFDDLQCNGLIAPATDLDMEFLRLVAPVAVNKGSNLRLFTKLVSGVFELEGVAENLDSKYKGTHHGG